MTSTQWRNGGGQGGRVLPDIFHWEIFAGLLGKRGQGRKGKWGGKEEKFEREEVENWKWKGRKGWKRVEGFFFFFSFLFFFFFFTCHFLKPLKFVWGLLKKKIIFHTGKKSGKLTSPVLKNISLTPLRQQMY